MKSRQLKLSKIKLVSIVLFSSAMAWLVYSAYAATASISLTSSRPTVAQSDAFTVTITVNTDTPAAYSTAKVRYNASQLLYQGADYTGSAYPTAGPDTNESEGLVTISRYIIPDRGAFPSGNFTLAKLNFQAKPGFAGQANITVEQSGSEIFGTNGVNVLTSVSGTNIAVTSPSVPPAQPVPPVANPASPPKASGSVAPPSGTTNSPAPSNASPTPDQPNVYPGAGGITGQQNPPLTPGRSRVVGSLPLKQRLFKLIRAIVPIVAVVAVLAGVAWLVFVKLIKRPFGYSVASPVSGGVGKVSLGPVLPSVAPKSVTGQPPQFGAPVKAPGTSSKPPHMADPSDHTPRTFSGV